MPHAAVKRRQATESILTPVLPAGARAECLPANARRRHAFRRRKQRSARWGVLLLTPESRACRVVTLMPAGINPARARQGIATEFEFGRHPEHGCFCVFPRLPAHHPLNAPKLG